MRLARTKAVVIAAMAAVALSTTASAGYAATTTPTAGASSNSAASSSGVAASLENNTDSQITANDAQCNLSVKKRTGAWSCPATSSNTTTAAPSAAAAAASGSRFCENGSPNCWTVNDDFNAEFRGINDYGYKDKVLGTYSWGFTWQLQGAQSVSKPAWIQFNKTVTNFTMEGERLYYNSTYRSGKRFNGSPTWNFYSKATATGNVTWSPNGYKAYENSASLGGVIHTVKWNVAGYPGTWTAYVKSPQFKKDGDVYRFMTAYNLPEDAWNNFWTP